MSIDLNNQINHMGSHIGNMFTSRVIPSNGLPVPGNNIEAAASYINCSKGGSKINRKKINKISRQYKKMKGTKKSIRKIKSRLRSKYASKKNRNRKNMKGGHSQYNNNLPMSSSYSTGGVLSADSSALASPVPYKMAGNLAIDNLNHNAKNSFGHNVGAGSASRGWW
jgi:hypothetical protein